MPEVEKKKRGRPPGSKNKPKTRVVKGTEVDKVYKYYFIADACGCRIGANIIGAGMWCEHKNTMHLEGRKQYSDYKN